MTSRPCPPEPARGPGDKSRSAALCAQRLPLAGQAGHPGLDRGTLGWTSRARREGRDAAGGNEDSRDGRELPEGRSGTWKWAEVYKREDGEQRETRRKGARGEELGDVETGGDEWEGKGLPGDDGRTRQAGMAAASRGCPEKATLPFNEGLGVRAAGAGCRDALHAEVIM